MIKYILSFVFLLLPFLSLVQAQGDFLPATSQDVFQFDPDNPTGTGYFTDAGFDRQTLPTRPGFNDQADQGTYQFRFLVERIINAIKWYMIPITMIIIAAEGVFLMVKRSDSAEFDRAKQLLISTATGFLVMTFAVVLVDTVFIDAINNPEQAGRSFNAQVIGAFNWITGLIVAVATLFLVIGAFQLMVAQGSDDAIERAKSRITWSTIGIVIILMSRTIYNLVTRAGGELTHPDVQGFIGLFGGWTNYVLSLVAFFSFIGIVYGGIRMIVGFGDEQGATTARTIVQGSVIALVVAIGAFVIISYLTRVF